MEVPFVLDFLLFQVGKEAQVSFLDDEPVMLSCAMLVSKFANP